MAKQLTLDSLNKANNDKQIPYKFEIKEESEDEHFLNKTRRQNGPKMSELGIPASRPQVKKQQTLARQDTTPAAPAPEASQPAKKPTIVAPPVQTIAKQPTIKTQKSITKQPTIKQQPTLTAQERKTQPPPKPLAQTARPSDQPDSFLADLNKNSFGAANNNAFGSISFSGFYPNDKK